MALFRRKQDTQEDQLPVDQRSKRGGVRRQTAEINIDLSALGKPSSLPVPAAPPKPSGSTRMLTPAGASPAADPTAAHGVTQRMVIPVSPGPGGSRRSTRSAGKGTPIGEHLIQAAAINTEQLTKALRVQEKQGGLVGQILVEMGACSVEDVAVALGKQFRPTQIDLTRVRPRVDAMLLFGADKCKQHKLIPFERLDQVYCVAMVNILNRKAVTQLESFTKLKVKAFTAPWNDILACIEKYYTPQVNKAVAQVEAERLSDVGRALALAEKLGADLAGAPARAAAPAAPAGPGAAVPAPAAPAPSPDEQAKPFIAEAQALRAQGKLGEAIKRLEVGLWRLPSSQKLRNGLAQLQKEFSDREAVDAARHAKVSELLAQGRAQREAGQVDEAMATIQAAAKLDPQNNVVAREFSNIQKEIARVKAELATARKLDEEARAAEEKRKAHIEAKKQSQIAELLALAKAARAGGRIDEAASRLKDVLAIDSAHGVARSRLAEVEAEANAAQQKRDQTIRTALRDAEKLVDAGRFPEAKTALQQAVSAVGEDPGLIAAIHDVDAAVRQTEKQREAAHRRSTEQKQEIVGEVAALIAEATAAFAGGDFEGAEQRLEDVLALDPENVEALSKVGEVRDAIRVRFEEQETARRADEERRKHEGEIRARLREAAEDRNAGRLELALRKLQEIDRSDPDRQDVKGALQSVEQDIERNRAEEAERLQREEEERRHVEEQLRQRAAVAAEASVDRKRVEASVGGEARLEAGSVSEESLVKIELTPEAQLAIVADAVARRTGGGVESTAEALRRLPVARIYAKSLANLRKLADAAKAAEVALAGLEASGEEAQVLELEFEPGLEPQPPMPNLEAQLEAEPQAILEAIPLEDEADAAGAIDAEIAEPVAEKFAATPMSEAEFEGLRASLEPDPVQDWCEAFASGGPVPAVPIEE